jgi:hypothetical protein
MKVRYVLGDIGEEHEIKLLPLCPNQIIRVREAFGREMIPDDSHAAEDGVIYVKAADRSPWTQCMKESTATPLDQTRQNTK